MTRKRDRSPLATNIVNLRKSRGWSQPELAHRVGVHVNTIKSIETDDNEGTKETRQAIAQALNVSMAELYLDELEKLEEPIQPHPDHPSPEELTALGGGFALSSPGRRLLALYLLTKDDSYYKRAAAIPDVLPIAKVLKKWLLSS